MRNLSFLLALILLSPASAFSQNSDAALGNVLCAANNDGLSTQSRSWFSVKPFSPGSGRSLEKDEGNYRIHFHRGIEAGSDGKTRIKITILPKGFTKLKFQKSSPPAYVSYESRDGELTRGAYGLAVLSNVGDQVRFQFSVNGMPETVVTCKILDVTETDQYHDDPNKILSLMAPGKLLDPKVSDAPSPDKSPAEDMGTASIKTRKASKAQSLESN